MRFIRNYFLLLLGFTFFLTSCNLSKQSVKKPNDAWMAAFYNVENLFDTINDPTINDEEFLPGSKLDWNTEKYQKSLAQKARVLAALDSLDFPHFVGLSEIENRAVLDDLVKTPALVDADYSIIHISDNDHRGIEVAAIYRSDYFKLLATEALEPNLEKPESMRHVLYVKGLISGGDTLHIFVNHWTSRYGGKDETAPRRALYGDFLRQLSDSLLALNPMAHIVIMGDLNDNPTDLSITAHLQAVGPNDLDAASRLFNLSLPLYEAGEGTLYYRSWDFFDQVIVSRALLNSEKPSVRAFEVVKHPWMLYQPNKGDARPNRMSSGGRYFGGFSDHLPVVLYLNVD